MAAIPLYRSVSDVAASLPDFGEPAIIPLAAVLGAFLGAAVARARRYPREDVKRLAEDGGFTLTGLALLVYLFGVITNLY